MTLSTTQTNAVNAYGKFLQSGMTYGEAMRAAAKELGDTPCITFLEALAKVHAAKYGCNYTWNKSGTAVFYTGDKSTRESRHGAAFQSWRRNVMDWFTPAKPAKPAKPTKQARKQRIDKDTREAATQFFSQFDGKNRAAQIDAAIAVLRAMR